MVLIDKLKSRRPPTSLILSAIVLGQMSHAQAPTVFIIHGRPRGCSNIIELDYARQGRMPRYFAGWSDQDYETAVQWAGACSQFGYPGWGPTRFQYLRALQAQQKQIAQKQAEAAQAAADRAAAAHDAEVAAHRAQTEENEIRMKKEAAEQAIAQARLDAQAKVENEKRLEASRRAEALRKCRADKPHKLFLAQQAVLEDLDTKARWDQALEKEKKIEELSGAENLSKKYFIGAQIVDAEEKSNRDFGEYKALGGSAAGPQSVTEVQVDPCQPAEVDEQ